MTREDFKRAIKAGKLSEALLLAISQAPELRITTWIASPETPTGEEKIEIDRSLYTQINLVTGEINNVIGERQISERHPEIERVHFDEVKRAGNTIQENLATVQKMLHSLAAFQQQSLPTNERNLAASPANEDSNIEQPETAVSEITEAQTNSIISEYDEVESVVDDMLSLADIDPEEAVIDETRPAKLEDEDWGDWLEDEANSDRQETKENPENWQ
ncbi:hypothetical protein [Myxosarcina sp. GI1]|uniref:hypothetical protein n=1 Tax=Myxosarcina sp. GI1 TaxID=1541065 RepID=UPI00068C5A19|nr:hypothetical protein [Myxosarcina sp. GI1]